MAVRDNLLPKCFICETTPAGGIAEGIMIGRGFLCTSCEMAIVRLRWNDDEDYDYYANRLKQVWHL